MYIFCSSVKISRNRSIQIKTTWKFQVNCLRVDVESREKEIKVFCELAHGNTAGNPLFSDFCILLLTNTYDRCAGVSGWWLWFLMNILKAKNVTFRPNLPWASVLVGYILVMLKQLYLAFYFFMCTVNFLPSPPQELNENVLSQWCTNRWRSHSPASYASSLNVTTPGLAHRSGSGNGWPKLSHCHNHHPDSYSMCV